MLMEQAVYMRSEDYLQYLIKNCGVRGYDFETKTEVCTRPDVDIILRYAKWLEINPTDAVLEIGCGVGRILKELHETFKVNPYGIDPFEKAIEAATIRVGSICKALVTSNAELIDFPNQSFDKIICWGVFDLTNQTAVLKEITRVLKQNGMALITGKTDCYESNDHEAIQAEKASLQKGIPNHYTNIENFKQWTTTLGLTISNHRYFKRRGDLSQDNPCNPSESCFYEYIFLLKREHLAGICNLQGPVVGKKNSDTFCQL